MQCVKKMNAPPTDNGWWWC